MREIFKTEKFATWPRVIEPAVKTETKWFILSCFGSCSGFVPRNDQVITEALSIFAEFHDYFLRFAICSDYCGSLN